MKDFNLPSVFNFNSLNIHLTPTLLWAVFAVVFGLTAIMSVILDYHWRSYGTKSGVILMVEIIYYSAVIFLLAGMAVCITLYQVW